MPTNSNQYCLSREAHYEVYKERLGAGNVGIIDIGEVTEPQIEKFNGEDIIVCAEELKWLSILLQNDFYCIAAMMNQNGDIALEQYNLASELTRDSFGRNEKKNHYAVKVLVKNNKEKH